MRQNPKRRLRNRYFTGAARTAVKKARTTVEEGTPVDARLPPEAISTWIKRPKKA
jgi:ribosomal protein S20